MKVGEQMNNFEKYGNVVWMDGVFIKPEEAHIPIFSHALHYASSWFEGIRTYQTAHGTAILMLDEHTQRMFDSPALHKRDFSQHFSFTEIRNAIIDVVKMNKLGNGYVRPLMYLGMNWNALMPNHTIEYHASIATWELTSLFTTSVSACISKRPRISNDAIPMQSKCAANYANSMLIKAEAIEAGFDDGIALDIHGNISETSASNLFMVKDGKLFTPSLDCSILNGFTRQLVIKIARELHHIEVVECHIKPEQLKHADEIFMTGSATGIVSVTTLDNDVISTKTPVSTQLMETYNEITSGNHHWSSQLLTYI